MPGQATTSLQEAPRRLHPFSMVRGIEPRQVLGSLPALFIFGANPDIPGIALGVGLVAILVVVAVLRVLAWQRRTYELADGRIVERSGIISRSERTLEVERIQQVDVERTLLDRVMGTCELRLETASDSSESELSLRVISTEEARRLRALLARRVGASAAQPPDGGGSAPEQDHGVFVPEDSSEERASEDVLVSVPLQHVVLAAVTGPRLLAVPTALAVLIGFVFESTPERAVDDVLDTAGSATAGIGVLGGILIGIAALVASVVIAGIVGALRDGGFTMAQRGSDLLVRRGLTTTRSATVPLRRVQRVTIKRRWLQAALGFAEVTVHSAGGGGGGESGPGAGSNRSLRVPLLPEQDVAALVDRVLGVGAEPDLRQHPPAARRRAVVRALLAVGAPAVALVAMGIVFDLPWLALLVVPVVALAVGGGLLAYRRLASGADAELVAGRTGLFGTVTEISPLRKTQGATVTSSVFQRRLGLANLQVHVAGPAGGIELQDLGELTAQRLAPTLHR